MIFGQVIGQKSLKMPIIPYSIRFSAITQPFFDESGLNFKFFTGTQETSVYRSVLTNLGFGPNLPFSMSLGSQNPSKKLTHLVDLLGELLSRIMFPIFLTSDPPPPPPPPLMANATKFSLNSNPNLLYVDTMMRVAI